MNELIKSEIDKKNLSGEFYVQSLLQEAYLRNLLQDAEMDNIKLQVLTLLADRVERYNLGESSSIRVEAAQSIMASNLYTIGVYLKSLNDPFLALEHLQTESISQLFQTGRKLIDEKLHIAKLLYQSVRRTKIQSPNQAYNDTIDNGVAEFFKKYDAEFGAHETSALIDYPLMNPVSDSSGVEYIILYLERLYFENLFCLKFKAGTIHALLLGYDENYQDLLINLFGRVFTNTLGCAFLERDIFALGIDSDDLQTLFVMLTADSLPAFLSLATEKICIGLFLNKELMDYMNACLPEITSEIRVALCCNCLKTVFVPLHRKKEEHKIRFSMGTKMEDDEFRTMVEAVMACDDADKKVTLALNKIKSLADLEDILISDLLEQKQVWSIFQMLDEMELAALLHRYLGIPEIEENLSGGERLLKGHLTGFVRQMPQRRQKRMMALVSNLEVMQ